MIIKRSLLLCLLLTFAPRANAQNTSIEVAIDRSEWCKITVQFNVTTAQPLIECWSMVPAVELKKAYSTCAAISGDYDASLFTQLTVGQVSDTLKIPEDGAAMPMNISLHPLKLKSCKAGSPRAPASVYEILGQPPDNYKYFVDYGGGQSAVVTVLMGTGISGGTKGTHSHKRSSCCCCGNTSDASDGRQPLPIPDVKGFYPQERSNWCWAATGQTIMDKVRHELNSQCTHAKRVLVGTTAAGILSKKLVAVDCGSDALNRGIDDFASDLTAFGYKAGTITDVPARMPSDLSAWIISWTEGGRHAMVLDHSDGDYVFAFDPWPVNEGAYFMMRENDAVGNAEFRTEQFYSSIHKL